jgi:DNA repair protein RadC
MSTNSLKVPLQKIPIYEVRLVQSRRPLRLAESIVPHAGVAAWTMHTMLGLTDREHFAALFLGGNHNVTGATIIAVGGQHGIGTIEARTVFRAAIAACASAIIFGHYVPRNIISRGLPRSSER